MVKILYQTVRPNWVPLIRYQHVNHLKFRPHMLGVPDLHTFQNYPLIKSFQRLPDDPYLIDNYAGELATRQRRYANYELNVKDPYTYDMRATDKDVFEQAVSDGRRLPRQFERVQDDVLAHEWMITFITQAGALAHLQECQKNDICLHRSPVKKITVDLHQIRQICYPERAAHNSPEGIHRDGADYIVSAFVVNRVNIVGGETIIYNEDYDEVFHETLERGEGMFHEDRDQLHYVEPIGSKGNALGIGVGFRDLFGIDITLT